MSLTFTKLFSSITASTIWAEPDHTRLVWITMLAMSDQHGRIHASIPGLANMARVSIEKCEEALAALKSPDKYSRTKDHDGRRIEDMDGGWRLLNHAKYRAIRDEESIKESKRRYINARRAAERVESVEQSRTQAKPVVRGRANTEADTEAEAKKRDTRLSALSIADIVAEGVQEEHARDWFKTRKIPLTKTAWEKVKREAGKAGVTVGDAVRISAEHSWRGFEADWLKSGRNGAVNKQEAIEQRNRQVGDRWLAQEERRDSE